MYNCEFSSQMMKYNYPSLKPVHLKTVKINFCYEYLKCVKSVSFILNFLKTCKMGDLVKGIYSLHSLLIGSLKMKYMYLIVQTEAYQACAYLVTAL